MNRVNSVVARVHSITWHGILVALRPYYRRGRAWWQAHAHLRLRLKAFRSFIRELAYGVRRRAIGSAMIVLTEQIQSLDELRQLSPAEIMRAYRAGRLDYLMQKESGYSAGSDERYLDWVRRGGRRRP